METTETSQILPMTDSEMETYRLHRRFDRMGRLVGDSSMERLFRAHVMIVGIGGVGSFAAEAIARSGVGKITLVDFDEICITNFNRQLHSLNGLVGDKKVEVMAERLRKINPQASVLAIPKFYNARFSEEIFSEAEKFHGERPQFVIDAIDSVTPKCHLLEKCRNENIRVVTSTGSGGKMDPTRIRVKDLGLTTVDPLAKALRRILRDQHGFPETGEFNIPAIYSEEPSRAPMELKYDNGKGFRCVCPQGQNEFFNCDNRNVILGNASFLTGAFGLACASVVVREICEQ
ncbi:MAG: tRNA threonylcarbamoyladenosine dehydratase [Bdellovibrionales bacterium]|nr:tRNA threonylcarbamoyladenosine dehydratase [Bdellovibrionales bacterium]